MLKAIATTALLVLAPSTGSAQDIIARDGWEAFPFAEYKGGDATQPKSKLGILVLTDTTLALYQCERQYCRDPKDKPPFKGAPIMVIPLRQIVEVSSSTTVRGPSTAGRIAFGLFAGDRTEEFFGVVYETESSAEAPVFKTERAHAGALEAKVRFRLRRLGVELREPVGTAAEADQ